MRKIFTLLVLSFITVQFVSAQTVVRDEIVNFSELAAYEAAHPELFKPCPTCPRKEADAGWEDFVMPTQPVPPGAIIKMAPEIPKKDPNQPTPDAPSRVPTQQWLGHVDPGSIIPPDTYGAVGLNHVVTATNDYIRIHNKVGGAVLSTVSISTFTGVPSTCDPQLFFDPNTQRWIFVAIDCSGSNGNPVIVMTSLTSNPTGSWRNFQFVPLAGGFLDHPYLGYDDTKIAIGGRKFAPSYTGPDVYLINKSDMLSGAAITFGVNAQTITKTSADGDSPRPVTVYFPPFSNSGNPSPGTIYILQSWSNNSLRLSTITGNIPTCVWNTGSAVFPTAPDSWTAGSMGSPGSVQQQGPETRRLAANDARVSSAIMMNGKIWCSHHIAFPAGATGTSITHTETQYWQLDGASGAPFGNVLQRGRTGAVAGDHRWFSAIAVNKNEDVIVGYSMSNATNMWPSAAYSTRQAGTPANTLDAPHVYHAGEGRYWKDFSSGRARWGDYSQSHLDPVDNSLWTIQQYASTPAGAIPPDNNSRYGVWWAQVPPSSVTPMPLISAGAVSLISESCVPANGVVDPGETVTMSFCLLNTGTANTVNAVGTLQTTGGIISPSGPMNYGAIVAGGAAVCQNFTFTNNSTTCLSTITPSIQVQDGASNLGTVSWTITLGSTVTASSENFDAVAVPALPAGWTASNATGPAPLWVTSNSGSPAPANYSAPNAAFVDNPGVVADKQLMTNSFTPVAGSRAQFRSNYSFESGGWDGGVLEISINGGAYTDIITAGGSFAAGGYTGTIQTGFSNPLAGRSGWVNSSGGFQLCTVNLPNAAAGQPVRLKFRMGSDNLIAGTGWRIDNFEIISPNCCGVPCTLTCPSNMTVSATPGMCGANVSFSLSGTGLCGPITSVPASGSYFPVGTTTVNVSSASGATCSFTVTVTDNVPPTITCPANITVPNAAGICGAPVTFSQPAVTDNCPAPVQIPASFANHGSGGVYTLQGNDLPGGVFFSITNNTPNPQTIAAFGVRFGNPAYGVVTAPQTLTIWSRPGALSTAIENSTAGWTAQGPQVVNPIPPYFPTGSGPLGICNLNTPVTLAPGAMASFFIHGQTACPVFNGTVGSITPPVSNMGFTLTGGSVSYDVLGSANHFQQGITNVIANINIQLASGITISQTAGLPSGSTFPVGTTTNTFQATDASGNSASCSFTVTVNDTEAPVFTTCPANQVRNTDPGVCYATFTPPQPVFADNCAVTRLTWTIVPPTGPAINSPVSGINYVPSTQFQLNGTTGFGISTITYTAYDAAGNSRTCTFTVRVNDASIPVISVQPTTKFVCVGSDGVFSVTASAGAGNPLTYQWQTWNGSAWVNVAGATSSSITIPSVTFAMNTNSYRCVLTGRCSVVISSFATMFVNPLPTVTLLTSIPPSLLPGQSLNISSTVNPAGGTYAWYLNNVLLSGATASSLNGLTVDDIGTYKLVYTDPNGCVNTSANLDVTGLPTSWLYVYPNPNNGQFQVRFYNQPGESATVRVWNEAGQKVFERVVVTSISYTRIDVDLGPTVADGTYVVELVNGSGKRVDAKKIVVRKKP